MKRQADRDFSRGEIEDLLYHALRTIYLFEQAEIEQFDVNYQQMYLLKFLNRKSPFRVSDIATELRIAVFAATRLVNQLEIKKFVIRNRDVKDRRNIFVHITEEGRALVGKIEAHIVDLIMSNLNRYSAEQFQLIIDVVKNLDLILGLRPQMKEIAESR